MVNEDQFNTDKTLAGGGSAGPSDGQAADNLNETNDSSNTHGGGVLLKEWAKNTLNKDFETDEAAEKAIKDTFSYVGEFGKVKKLAEDKGITIEQAIQSFNKNTDGQNDQFVSREQYEKDMFYEKNPSYAPYSKIINALAKDLNIKIHEVINTDEFKGMFDKAQKFDEIDTSKSVLKSNPKLGVVKDKMAEAGKSLQAGDYDSAKKSAVGAVLDAFSQ